MLRVTAEEGIALDGCVIMPLEQAGGEPLVIGEVEEAMARARALDRRAGVQANGMAITTDKQVQFRIIKKLMATSASAGFDDISFATLTK